MAFRLTSAADGRAYNSEAISLSRRKLTQEQSCQQHMEDNSNIDNNGVAPKPNSKEASAEALPSSAITPTAQQRRNIVFPDPVAFRYLEQDGAVSVVKRTAVLPGYELYLVEQWACSRLSPTLVIVTYTGDENSCIMAGVLSVPVDREAWSPELRVYFKALEQNHARPKDTPIGELMVTNLSSFPSALTVIPVPNGDIRQNRQMFIVNEDLKRLGCSGRAGLTLADPSNATRSKFYQLYKVNDKIHFADAIVELVKLCQVALLMFGKLEHEYIDGLLCDKTETAVNNWWTQVGTEYYNIEPTDGILGPTTVAALLGTLMGARNRLASCSCPVSKDVFDVDATKRGIGAFQKAHKLERTRRLDRKTLLKLHTVTAKAAAGETWGVQKAVKSTVAEIGGKRGELVIGMVGGRDKGGISDIETLDIEKFISLATGERIKWLWYGKPRRTGTAAEIQDKGSPSLSDVPNKDESTPTKNKRAMTLPLDEAGLSEARTKEQLSGLTSPIPPGSANSTLDSPLSAEKKRTVFKSVAGRMNDARSGLGRIKDAVGGGLRGHVTRPSRDEPFSPVQPSSGASGPADSSAATHNPTIGRAFTWKQKPEEYLTAMRKGELDGFPNPTRAGQKDRQPTTSGLGITNAAESSQRSLPLDLKPPSLTGTADIRKGIVSSPPSITGSIVDEKDLRGPILDQEQCPNNALTSLCRRHSVSSSNLPYATFLNQARWPRRMSFSDAEDAVLTWEGIHDPVDQNNPDEALNKSAARDLFANILSIKENIEPWVLTKLSAVESLDATFADSQEQLETLYYQLSEEYQRAKEESQELVAEQRTHTMESIKDIELLAARLEYEIDSLVSKVQEVEEGVAHFEREVENVERRAQGLKAQLETESWAHWFVRTLTGVGTGPNITRPRA